MSDEKKKKKKGSFKNKLLWAMGIIGTLLLIRQTTMLLLIGMLPTLVVKFIDNTEDRLWFKTVLCFNLAGVYPYVIDIVMVHNNSMKAMQAQMADSIMWLVMYGSASIGYAAMWCFPIATEFCMRVLNRSRLERHSKKIEKLRDEWGVGEVISVD